LTSLSVARPSCQVPYVPTFIKLVRTVWLFDERRDIAEVAVVARSSAGECALASADPDGG